MDDREQFARNLLYRIAYGDADRWSEIRRYDHAYGKEPARSDRTRGELVEAVVRRLGTVDAEDLEAIEEGVEDALEGRLPRW
jgi:hypothetical protein